jgi:Zn-dependent protease with chaperone function
MKSAPAEYFDGNSPNAIAGVLTATPEGLRFAREFGAPTPDGAAVHFTYDQMTDATADDRGCRINVSIDAAESREFRFADRELLRYARAARRESSRGFAGLLQTLRDWSIARKILVGALLLPVSIGAFFFAIEGAYVFIPEAADRRLGDQAAAYLESGMDFCEEPRLEAAVSEMLTRLVGEENRDRYTVRIVSDPEVNALALPSGGIYIFSGLLEESESAAEVAGVLAHEIGHIQERHSMRQLIQALGFTYLASMLLGAGFEELEIAETISELATAAVFFKYSRDFEREADLFGLEVLREAGIGGQGLLDFFARRATPGPEGRSVRYDSLENLDRALPDFLSSHPADEERTRYLQAALGASTAAGAGDGVSDVRARGLASEAEWKELRILCSPWYDTYE